MKIPRWFTRSKKRIVEFISGFNRKDIPGALMTIGLSLLGYGASQIRPGYGPIIVGLLLVLYVKPLTRWVK